MIHLITACMYAMLSIAIGAFGRHFLDARLSSEELMILEIASKYLYWTAMPILILALTRHIWSWSSALLSIFAWSGGIFSGTLIIYVLLDIQSIIYLTPVGGILMLIAWAMLIVSVIQSKKSRKYSQDSLTPSPTERKDS